MAKDALYIYGKHPVEELIAQEPRSVADIAVVNLQSEGGFQELIAEARRLHIPVRSVSKQEAISMVGDVNTQRVIAQVKHFQYHTLKSIEPALVGEDARLVVVLDKVEDVHNFGAILRSAAAAGVSAVCVANAGQAPVSGTVFKTSAGAALKVPIVEVANIADTLRKLKDFGFWVYAVDMADGVSQDIYQQAFDKKSVLVVGGESSGVSRIVREVADFLVHIPMENAVESLNVSVAAALAMYEYKRQVAEQLL